MIKLNNGSKPITKVIIIWYTIQYGFCQRVIYDIVQYKYYFFSAEDIPKEWENKWKTVDVYPDLFLPHPNIFIAKDTELKILDSKDIQAFPTKLVSIAILLKLHNNINYIIAILLQF